MKNMIALTGIGYDIHRFAEIPRPLMLGGVHIPSSRGLDGHSDADVLCHAIADALLGAAGLPDIGYWFPPGDPACKDIPSLRPSAPSCSLVVALMPTRTGEIPRAVPKAPFICSK